MNKNKVSYERLETREDIKNLKSAKKVKGQDLTPEEYIKKRGLQGEFKTSTSKRNAE